MATDGLRGPGSGGTEPGMPAASSPAGPPGVPAPSGSSAPPGRVAERAGWTVGRVIALLAGSVLVLASVILLGGSGAVAWADHEQQGDYLSTGTATYSTGGYALAGNPVRLPGGWNWLGWLVGDVRIRVTATSPARAVFVAIAPAADVSRYLTGVSYLTVTAFGDQDVAQHLGIAAPAPPATALDWSAQAEGTGTPDAALDGAHRRLDGGRDEPGRVTGRHCPHGRGSLRPGAAVAGDLAAGRRRHRQPAGCRPHPHTRAPGHG